jgi:hypothetical protein
MNAVFIHIPKTAGLYIQEALGLEILRYPTRAKKNFRQTGMVTFGHQKYERLRRIGVVGDDFDRSAFKFAFCRNPFDRAVSHYFYVRKKHPERMSMDVSFIDYTRTLQKYGSTFGSQSLYLGEVDLDYLGRFEQLDADLADVAGLLGREIKPTPRRNKTRHEPYHTYYCDESEENIRKYYRKDFDLFGYDDHLLH